MIEIIIEQISEDNYIDNADKKKYLPKPNVVSSATLGDLTIEDY